MPDLLGATNPVPGYDKSLSNNRMPQTAPENPQIQNAPDLTKVNRADRRTDRQDSNLQGDGPIRYDSNFQTFLQRLRAAPSMSESLSRLFAGERTVVLSGMSEGVATEMAKAFELLEMDEGQLLEFLKGQMRAGTRFGGALFALLRGHTQLVMLQTEEGVHAFTRAAHAFWPGLSAPPEELAARLLYQISQQELTLKKLMKCSAPALQTIL